MSHVAKPRIASLAGILVVLLFVAFAVAGPVIMVRDRLRASAGAATAQGTAGGGGNVVAMVGLKFQPGTLTVAKGTTVVFGNGDTAPHTVTARSGGPTPGSSTRVSASAWSPLPASTTSAGSIRA
jgi:plastocyanin